MSEAVFGIWRQQFDPVTRRWGRRVLVDTALAYQAALASRILMRRYDSFEQVRARYAVRKLRRPVRVRVLA